MGIGIPVEMLASFMTSINHPPMPDSFIHAINLTTADSKITAVSVYTDRAEVTRSFRIQLQTGQNHVKITRLPNVLQDDSVRLSEVVMRDMSEN